MLGGFTLTEMVHGAFRNDMVEDPVRKDLYGVQERGNGFDEWCYQFICRSRETAVRLRSTLVPILGFSHSTRIVHPTQTVVDVYVAAGNEIRE